MAPGRLELHQPNPRERPAETDEGTMSESVSQNPAPTPEHIMQFFAYLHLPPKLQEVARPFCELAKTLVDPDGQPLPRNPERTVALRKLLEAKDAAVRAALAT
jgi:hypothetical protein